VDRQPVDPVAALAAHAARDPESPFLFFRDARGHFAWWSWAETAAALRDGAEPSAAGAAQAIAYVRAALAPAARDAALAAAELLTALGAGDRRDIWLTRGDLASPGGRALALAALAGGWAVVHEPAAAIHPATFLWARPTIVGGAAAELDELMAGCSAQAPRWRREAWLAKRLRRLRAVVVAAGEDPRRLAARLAALGATARVLSNPSVGW